MGKRFTDCDKWTKNKWFRKLKNEYKLFWLFILDQCDSVGVWEEDIEFASMLLGYDYSTDSLLKVFGNRIAVISGKEKWWIKDFIFFQYGVLDEENIKNRPHQSYITLLKKHSLWIDYQKTIYSLKEKEKDKDKEKEKEKERKFEHIWEKYPNKDGRKLARGHFNASVKNKQDWQDINKALNNYLSCKRVKDGYTKNGSTWFNNWRDWIDYEEKTDNTPIGGTILR